mmetsp:Transcript_97891/g.153073  ORF Transcript_97891/g.153073 Transcript_97891/m.153073 type:complete len:110 (-) Transcript_97891:52-381(-)
MGMAIGEEASPHRLQRHLLGIPLGVLMKSLTVLPVFRVRLVELSVEPLVHQDAIIQIVWSLDLGHWGRVHSLLPTTALSLLKDKINQQKMMEKIPPQRVLNPEETTQLL